MKEVHQPSDLCDMPDLHIKCDMIITGYNPKVIETWTFDPHVHVEFSQLSYCKLTLPDSGNFSFTGCRFAKIKAQNIIRCELCEHCKFTSHDTPPEFDDCGNCLYLGYNVDQCSISKLFTECNSCFAYIDGDCECVGTFDKYSSYCVVQSKNLSNRVKDTNQTHTCY